MSPPTPQASFFCATFCNNSTSSPPDLPRLRFRSGTTGLFRASKISKQTAGFLGADKSDNDSRPFLGCRKYRNRQQSFFVRTFAHFAKSGSRHRHPRRGYLLGGQICQNAGSRPAFLVRIFSNYPKSARSLFLFCFSLHPAAVFFCSEILGVYRSRLFLCTVL